MNDLYIKIPCTKTSSFKSTACYQPNSLFPPITWFHSLWSTHFHIPHIWNVCLMDSLFFSLAPPPSFLHSFLLMLSTEVFSVLELQPPKLIFNLELENWTFFPLKTSYCLTFWGIKHIEIFRLKKIFLGFPNFFHQQSYRKITPKQQDS